jgi:hypothetical protein
MPRGKPKPNTPNKMIHSDQNLPRRAFPTHVLPGAFREMSKQVEGYAKCGSELPGISLIGVANAAIGPGLVVYNPKTGDETPSNLYFLCAAEPGSGKSRVMKPIQEPLIAYQSAMRESWSRDERPKLESRLQELKAELKRMDKRKPAESEEEADQQGGSPEGMFNPNSGTDSRAKIVAEMGEVVRALIAPRMMVKDITVQSLGVFLQEHDGRAISIDPDAREPISNILGKMNNGSSDENIYLGAFYGESYLCDRITRGEVVVEKPWLSILWLVQNDKFEELLKNRNIFHGGFLSRFLFCEVDAPPSPRGGTAMIDADKANDYAVSVRRILAKFFAAKESARVTLSAAAVDRLDAYHNGYHAEYEAGRRDYWTFENRYAELASRLALTLHVMRYADYAPDYEIALEEVEGAIEVVEWFAEVRQGLYSLIKFSAEEARLMKISEMCRLRALGFTLRDACRMRLAGTDKKAKNEELIQELIDQGVLVRFEDPEGGSDRFKMRKS